MRVILVSVILALALASAECGLISSFMENIPFFGSSSNSSSASTSTASPITASSDKSVVAPPCVPPSTLSPTIEAFKDHLPPQYAALITPENVKALENVGDLAGLATSAATGNPVAIVKLAVFLAGPNDPLPTLFSMAKQIVPLLKPADLAGTVSNFTSSASATINTEFNEFKQQLTNLLNKPKPTAAPAPTVQA